jgi:glycosyltransferase involved in cell wall biosynthesis
MAVFTFIVVCKGRLEHVRQTLGSLVKQPEGVCIVVDYSCPDKVGDWVAATYPEVRVVRVPGEEHINVARARNLGAATVDTPWLCFADADVSLHPGFAAELLPRLTPKHSYHPHPFMQGAGGVFVCSREDFLRTGGFDEVLQVYGDDDYDLFDGLRFVGVTWDHFPAQLRQGLRHGNDLRLQYFPIKKLRESAASNRVYRTFKWQFAAMRGELLPLELRRELYAMFRRDVPAIMQRERLTEDGLWNWTPFEQHIIAELERRTGRSITPEQRTQIQKSLEMKMG